MDLVLFGIQGSGKGTQAKKLAAEFGYDIFEAGGELRRIKATGSELGMTIASYIDKGELVPFEIIMQVVREAVSERSPSQPILFDGIPRDADQSQSFDQIMKDLGRPFRCVCICMGEEAAVQRVLGRAAKEGRSDDADEDVIRRRIQNFKNKTMPIVDKYRAEGLLTDVDGEGTVDEVYDRLKEALDISLATVQN